MGMQVDVPIGEPFLAPDGQTYKAVNSGCAFICRGCAFNGITKLCYRYSCDDCYRKDHTAVHFVKCEDETKKGE